jgi:diacylglycerol kinase family enzyme
MTHAFDEIVIIYNPKSTGSGKQNAEKLRDDLLERDESQTITLLETEYAGHAEKIAISYARRREPILLISSSGDGAYHELINGVLSEDATNITVGVLPSGNANDHFSAFDNDEATLVDSIINGHVRAIDTLRVTSTVDWKPWSRYAHSYAGIGLSPTIGKELTKAKLNFVNEKILLLKYFFKYTHATIRRNGKKERFSSLVFSNIHTMSKVIKLSKKGSVDDGLFEVSSVPYRSKWYVLLLMLKSATVGVDETGSYESYTFETTKKLLMQLDGEVYTIDADSSVLVECQPLSIKTIL